MGYSIAVPLKSHKAREQMFEWLSAHLRPWSAITRDHPEIRVSPDYDTTRYLLRGEDLSYDKGRTKIGFDQSITSHQTICILRWCSLKLGRRRPFRKEYKLDVSVPYIVYDGFQGWPTLNKDEWEGKCPESARWCLVDRFGFKPELGLNLPPNTPVQPWMEEQERQRTLSDRLIHEELQRLDALWENTATAKKEG